MHLEDVTGQSQEPSQTQSDLFDSCQVSHYDCDITRAATPCNVPTFSLAGQLCLVRLFQIDLRWNPTFHLCSDIHGPFRHVLLHSKLYAGAQEQRLDVKLKIKRNSQNSEYCLSTTQ